MLHDVRVGHRFWVKFAGYFVSNKKCVHARCVVPILGRKDHFIYIFRPFRISSLGFSRGGLGEEMNLGPNGIAPYHLKLH